MSETNNQPLYLEIILSNGSKTLVDAKHYNHLNQWPWYEDKEGYARRTDYSDGKAKTILMHREITGAPKGNPVDHINGSRKDNREENLRICSYQQNAMNQKSNKNTPSGYKGVSWDKGSNKWRVFVKKDGKKRSFGRYKCKHEAARVYNQKAFELFGEFARLNVIESEAVS